MFWIYGVGLAGPSLTAIVHALLYFAKDLAYKDLKNADMTTATKAGIVYKAA